jgi:hypothetical protein
MAEGSNNNVHGGLRGRQNSGWWKPKKGSAEAEDLMGDPKKNKKKFRWKKALRKMGIMKPKDEYDLPPTPAVATGGSGGAGEGGGDGSAGAGAAGAATGGVVSKQMKWDSPHNSPAVQATTEHDGFGVKAMGSVHRNNPLFDQFNRSSFDSQAPGGGGGGPSPLPFSSDGDGDGDGDDDGNVQDTLAATSADTSSSSSPAASLRSSSNHSTSVRCASFRQRFALEDAIGSHACSLQTSMRVINGIHLGCSLLLLVDAVNLVQTLKVTATQTATLTLALTMDYV